MQESKDFIKHEIGREASDEEIEDFLNKLVFAVNLPSGAELREIIKSEFCKEFSNTKLSDSDLIEIKQLGFRGEALI